MSFTNVVTYNNAAAFDVDTLAEVTTRAGLVNQTPTDATSWATATTDEDLNGGSGLRAGSLSSGAVVEDGWIKFDDGGMDYIDWSAVGNADFTQTGTIKWKVYIPYNGIPTNDQQLLYISETLLSSNNVVSLFHRTSGLMQILLSDSVGTGMLNVALGSWIPVQGSTNEIELNIDIDTTTPSASAVLLLINGVPFGTTQTGFAGTVGAKGSWRMGAYKTGVNVSNHWIQDVVTFDTVQHTTDYSPGYTLPESTYATIPQSVMETAGQLTDGIDSLAEGTPVVPAGTALAYNANIGGVDYFYNAVTSVWEIAADYNDVNTLAEYNTNIASLDLSAGEIARRKLWLISTSGEDTPTLATSTMTYSYFETIGSLAYCVVVGYLTDNGVPVSGGTVTYKTTVIYGVDNTSNSINRTDTSRSTGYYETPLLQGASVEVKQVWVDSNNKKQSKEGVFVVPALDQADLEDLI